MTVINTNYSNIEEVWGSPFEKPKKKKSKQSVDPLCDLYGKRYNKLLKPYGNKSSTPLDDEYVHRYSMFDGENTQTNTQFYGYDDSKPFSRSVNKQRQQKFDLDIDEEAEMNYKCMDLNDKNKLNKNKSIKPKTKKKSAKKQVIFNIPPEDDDEVYLQQAVQQEAETEQEDFARIYTSVYDESDDEGNEDTIPDMFDTDVEDEDSSLINQQMKLLSKNTNLKSTTLPKKLTPSDERQYLDIIIYTLSGIILIFMMEQFVQIGMRIRTSY